MAHVKWVTVIVVAGVAVLLMGAWERPVTPASPVVHVDFVAQPISLADGVPTNPASLLDAACAALHPDRVFWLQTTIWQQTNDPDIRFEAEGPLLLGPSGCARLELAIRTQGATCQMLVVSDGHALAQRFVHADRTEVVKGHRFPSDEDTGDPWELAHLRDLFLHAHCCGGPRGLLDDLALSLVYLEAKTGVRHGTTVIQLQGWRLPQDNTEVPVQVTVYLTPESLWPIRVEWRRLKPTGVAPEPYLAMEFRNPVLNQPLSREQCERAFTFQPREREP